MVNPQTIVEALFFAVAIFFGLNVGAQQKNTDSLTCEILQQDSLVFGAFNGRNLATFKNAFAQDLEFFHDKGGLTGYDHIVKFLQSTIANDNGLRRTLVAGSTEVYPIPNYGAMQMGSHTFCHPEKGKSSCGTFQFVHIWKKTDSGWKITRVVSYGH